MATRIVWLYFMFAVPLLATEQAPATRSGLIVGRVIDAVSGQPVASARVRLARGGSQPLAAVLTDGLGRFAFARLPAGSFRMDVSRPGYLEGTYGHNRPGGSSVRLILEEGERRGNVVVAVWPTASISGTVLDELSMPLPGVSVFARRLLPGGAPDLGDLVGTGVVADREGRYRIDGLRPGEYVVSVFCRTTTAPVDAGPDTSPVATGAFEFPDDPGGATIYVQPNGEQFSFIEGPLTSVPRVTYVTTYHGAATLASEATAVAVAAGEDRLAVDITMARRPAIDVSGTVVGLGAGERGVVRLLPPDQDVLTIDEDAPSVATAVTDAGGGFTMFNVPAGGYLLQAYLVVRAPTVDVSTTGVPTLRSTLAPEYTRGRWATMPISFGDQDVDGVTPRLRDGVTIRGVIQFAESLPSSPAPLSGTMRLGDRFHRIAARQAETFEMTNVRPGLQDLIVQGFPSGWGLISAQVDGREVAGIGLQVGTDDIDSLTVTVGPYAALTGQITADGRPARDATVVLYPTDSTMWRIWRTGNARLRTLRTVTGSFSFAAIPPGEYFVVAVDDAVLERWPAPEFLRRLSAAAERLTLAGGQPHTRALVLDRTVR